MNWKLIGPNLDYLRALVGSSELQVLSIAQSYAVLIFRLAGVHGSGPCDRLPTLHNDYVVEDWKVPVSHGFKYLGNINKWHDALEQIRCGFDERISGVSQTQNQRFY